MAQIHIRANVTKNSKGQQNKFERAMRAIKKKEKRAAHRKGESTNQFSALHLLNDPQVIYVILQF